MSGSSRYEDAFPELFAPLSTRDRVAVSKALNDDRLSGGVPARGEVALLITSIVDGMGDAEFLRAVLDAVNEEGGAVAVKPERSLDDLKHN